MLNEQYVTWSMPQTCSLKFTQFYFVFRAAGLYTATKYWNCLQLLIFLIDMGNELSSMVQKVNATHMCV
jgi:hypothetical protein